MAETKKISTGAIIGIGAGFLGLLVLGLVAYIFAKNAAAKAAAAAAAKSAGYDPTKPNAGVPTVTQPVYQYTAPANASAPDNATQNTMLWLAGINAAAGIAASFFNHKAGDDSSDYDDTSDGDFI